MRPPLGRIERLEKAAASLPPVLTHAQRVEAIMELWDQAEVICERDPATWTAAERDIVNRVQDIVQILYDARERKEAAGGEARWERR